MILPLKPCCDDAPRAWRGRGRAAGFTLVEMLVSITILLVLMTIIFQIISMTTAAWKLTTQGAGTMQQARVAFERMTRNLSQATLNTYYSYLLSGGIPQAYIRQSELQFISGYTVEESTGGNFITAAGQGAKQVTHAVFFQAPLGVTTNPTTYANLGNLLNACGYFVMYGPDTFSPSFYAAAGFTSTPPTDYHSYRFRLMEFLQPSEYLSIYTPGSIPNTNGTGTTVPAWITNGLPTDLTVAQTAPNITVRPVASNIVALIIMPEYFTSGTTTNGEANTSPIYSSGLGATYCYDSAYNSLQNQVVTSNQLPPLVKVIMVAIDEPSAIRLAAAKSTATSKLPPDLGNLSTSAGSLFQDPTKLQADLVKFQAVLNATPGNVVGNTIKLNYYIFQTDVIIRGAKWSSN